MNKFDQFIQDMEERGFEVDCNYHGRYFYVGPAAMVDENELQDVIRATDIPLQWDTMGKNGLVIYPK